ncbi:MAG: P-II family nitrogen regulator [Sphaerochaetaceae bacterium]|nr:P-II family nitrogen regulator [Sphaerochaetaceae bacterium]
MLLLEGSLLLAVLGHNQADRFSSVARQCGATGATAVPAKGTASSKILRLLGMGDKSRDLVLVLLDDNVNADTIISEAKADPALTGICALLNSDEEKNMKAGWKMVTIITNTGYADDIMHAAREAGAEGGTVIHARGTAPADAEHFLGVVVVPDKEMVMILCPEEKEEQIISAVNSLSCLKEKGVGIMYSQAVEKFENLGE